jgi:hypothetical protein
MEVIPLSREEYLSSIKKINNYESLKFAKQSLDWWDNYYSWIKFPPLSLRENGEDLAYLFYSIAKDDSYLTIHNLLTPKKFRGSGYAFIILEELFKELSNGSIERFKMFCVSSSLKFYNKIGLNYWGVNSIGQYYCDFEMPTEDIFQIKKIVSKTIIDDISKENLNYIYNKVKTNGEDFEELDILKHQESILFMKNRYLFEKLLFRANLLGLTTKR